MAAWHNWWARARWARRSSTGREGRSGLPSGDGNTARVASDDTGGWQFGDLDLSEYLDRYRNQRVVLIIAPIGEAEPATYTCGICGFVVNEVGECPRCKLAIQEGAAELDSGDAMPDILGQVSRLLTELDGDQASEEPI